MTGVALLKFCRGIEWRRVIKRFASVSTLGRVSALLVSIAHGGLHEHVRLLPGYRAIASRRVGDERFHWVCSLPRGRVVFRIS
jgi:hypothetical protein